MADGRDHTFDPTTPLRPVDGSRPHKLDVEAYLFRGNVVVVLLCSCGFRRTILDRPASTYHAVPPVR